MSSGARPGHRAAQDAAGSQPLSLEQRAVWRGQEFLGRAAPGYTASARYRIDGPVDPDLLRQAVGRLLARPALLRSVLRPGEPEPRFAPLERFDPPFTFRDGSAEAEPGAVDAAAEALIRRALREPFALHDALLCRYLLLRLDEARHILLIRHHHILCDGWAGRAAFSELTDIYNALADGREPDPAGSVDYAEHLAAQDEYLASGKFAEDEAFWRGHLAGLAPEPLFAPRPGRRDEFGEIERLGRPFPADLRTRLEALAREAGGSLPALLLAGTALLAARLSGRGSVLVGVPFLNRQNRRMRSILGHTLRMLPLSVPVDMDQGFARLVADTARLSRQAMRHGRHPAEELAGSLGMRLPCGHVFDITLNHLQMFEAVSIGHASVHELPAISGREPKILSLLVWEGRDGASEFFLDHSLNHLDHAAAATWLERLVLVLARAAAEPDRPCGGLDILLPGETALLARVCQGPLRTWGRNAAAPRRIHELFEAVAAARPKGLAVAAQELPGGGLTYAQLDAAANRVARALRAAGVRPGEPVAVVCGRTPELPAAAAACISFFRPDTAQKTMPIRMENTPRRMTIPLAAKTASR